MNEDPTIPISSAHPGQRIILARLDHDVEVVIALGAAVAAKFLAERYAGDGDGHRGRVARHFSAASGVEGRSLHFF